MIQESRATERYPLCRAAGVINKIHHNVKRFQHVNERTNAFYRSKKQLKTTSVLGTVTNCIFLSRYVTRLTCCLCKQLFCYYGQFVSLSNSIFTTYRKSNDCVARFFNERTKNHVKISKTVRAVISIGSEYERIATVIDLALYVSSNRLLFVSHTSVITIHTINVC